MGGGTYEMCLICGFIDLTLGNMTLECKDLEAYSLGEGFLLLYGHKLGVCLHVVVPIA